MGVKFLLTSLAIAELLSGCQSSSMTKGVAKLGIETSLAESKARDFFSALHHGDRHKMLALYPACKQLEQTPGSDTATFRSVAEKDGALVITFRNTQGTEKGFRTEKDVQLFFHPDTKGQMILFDSKGLANFEKREEYLFGIKTGCINTSRDTTDQLMVNALARSRMLLPEKAFSIYMDLKQGIQVTDWNWGPGDNGSAFGEGMVHNGSSYSLPELKYKITYHDNKGDTLATDKGNVTYEKLQPGDNPTFTFYTSYVGKPSKAVIELVFDDDLVFGFLSKKAWTGKEWEEYSSKLLTKK
jgi:hypothetical protein